MKKQPKLKQRPGLDEYGRTELHYAAARGDTLRAIKLLAAGLSACAADDDGWTPLHAAAQGGAVAVCEALLDAGALIDAQDAHGNTPLFRAVFESKGAGEIIQLLRARGANPHLKNRSGISPVGLARTIGNYDVRRFFDDLPDE